MLRRFTDDISSSDRRGRGAAHRHAGITSWTSFFGEDGEDEALWVAGHRVPRGMEELGGHVPLPSFPNVQHFTVLPDDEFLETPRETSREVLRRKAMGREEKDSRVDSSSSPSSSSSWRLELYVSLLVCVNKIVNLGMRARRQIRRDYMSYAGALMAFGSKLLRPEYLIAMFILALGSTIFFTYYTSDGTNNVPLAARLRFNIIGTLAWLPATILVVDTSARREAAQKRLAAALALVSQIHQALLTWRITDKNQPFVVRDVAPGVFEAEVLRTCKEVVRRLFDVLSLPPMNRDRYFYTAAGRARRNAIKNAHRDAVARVMDTLFELNSYVQVVKDNGLSPMESIRIFNYIGQLQMNVEQLVMTKVYRTSSAARSFTRVVVLGCFIFYGPYYSFVSGNLDETPNPATTPPAFSAVLSVVSAALILGTVTMHRTIEDPFYAHSREAMVDASLSAREELRWETAAAVDVSVKRGQRHSGNVMDFAFEYAKFAATIDTMHAAVMGLQRAAATKRDKMRRTANPPN